MGEPPKKRARGKAEVKRRPAGRPAKASSSSEVPIDAIDVPPAPALVPAVTPDVVSPSRATPKAARPSNNATIDTEGSTPAKHPVVAKSSPPVCNTSEIAKTPVSKREEIAPQTVTASVASGSRAIAQVASENVNAASSRGSAAAVEASSDRQATENPCAFLRLSSVCNPSMKVKELVYLEKDEVTFGRMPTNTVVLDSVRAPQMISRVHGRLVRQQSEGQLAEWTLIDNKSMNGICVNGEPIQGENGRPLAHGDTIVFGRKMVPPEFEFVFCDPVAQMRMSSEPPGPSIADFQEEFEKQHQKVMELEAELRATKEKKVEESQMRAKHESDLQSELQCSICQDWVVHAATIECSHTFCWACIDSWLLQKKFECPVCRHTVTKEPVRSRAIDAIVQKTVEKCGTEQKTEYEDRIRDAEKTKEKVRKLHKSLEKSVNDAIAKGKAFFSIDSAWSRREKDTFQRGVKDMTGDTRETYCRLTGLTVRWVHSADENKLNQALHNLGLQNYVNDDEADIRKRLLMFLRYG